MDSWLAGRRGSFTYQYKKGSHASFRVSCGSRDRDVIEYLHEMVDLGGVMESDLAGRPFWTYYVSGKEAYALMIAVYPWMFERRQQQIRECIEEWKRVPVGNKWKTHCVNGHPLTPDNLYQWDLDRGRRRCLICRNEYAKRAEQKRSAKNKEDLQ